MGYADGLSALGLDGDITQTELESVDAVGAFLNDASLALTYMRSIAPQLLTTQLSFTALQADAGSVGLTGIPGLELFAENLVVRLMKCSATFALPGLAPPVVEFVSSLGAGG